MTILMGDAKFFEFEYGYTNDAGPNFFIDYLCSHGDEAPGVWVQFFNGELRNHPFSLAFDEHHESLKRDARNFLEYLIDWGHLRNSEGTYTPENYAFTGWVFLRLKTRVSSLNITCVSGWLHVKYQNKKPKSPEVFNHCVIIAGSSQKRV